MTPPIEPIPDERAAFENWQRHSLHKYDAWSAWKARAALAARTQPLPPADEPRHPDAGILEVHYRQSHRVDMPQEFYDTLASLCELVGPKRRQEFDALLSKFVDHISAVVNPPDEPTAVAALRELVACKDLKQKWESAEADFQVPAEVWTAIREEYKRRQPLAWEAARQALAPRAIPASTPGQSETHKWHLGKLLCEAQGGWWDATDIERCDGYEADARQFLALQSSTGTATHKETK